MKLPKKSKSSSPISTKPRHGHLMLLEKSSGLSDESKDSYKPTRRELDSLGEFLPTGFSNFFTVVRAGSRPGLRTACPLCGARPPAGLKYGHRKWRWTAAHMVTEHNWRKR